MRRARRVVLELLASSIDTSTAPELLAYLAEYGADPARFGADVRRVDEPLRDDNDAVRARIQQVHPLLQVRRGVRRGRPVHFRALGRGPRIRRPDRHRRGHAAARLPMRVLRQLRRRLPDRGTDALDRTPDAAGGEWDEPRQHVAETICPYCGVGCAVELHVQDNRIVKVTSPADHASHDGNLCVKGRFGFTYVRPDDPDGEGER